jgi:hypothetical protein
MKTEELLRVLNCLEKIKRPNPFADEAIAYVKKDLAIREQQRQDMRYLNKPDSEWPW